MTTVKSQLRRPASPPGAVDELAVEELADVLVAITRNARRELQLPVGVSAIAALVTINAQGPIRMGDLAAHEGVTPATLSRVVSVLEEQGFVERIASETDRRSASLVATPSGRRLLDKVRRDRGKIWRGRVERLTPAQRKALKAALPALRALIQA